MLHDRQGSVGLFGPFAYTIVAADVAANADAAAQDQIRCEAKPSVREASTVESLFHGLLTFATSIARPRNVKTA